MLELYTFIQTVQPISIALAHGLYGMFKYLEYIYTSEEESETEEEEEEEDSDDHNYYVDENLEDEYDGRVEYTNMYIKGVY